MKKSFQTFGEAKMCSFLKLNLQSHSKFHSILKMRGLRTITNTTAQISNNNWKVYKKLTHTAKGKKKVKYSSTYSEISHPMWVASLRPRPFYAGEGEPRHPPELGSHQSWSGRFGNEKTTTNYATAVPYIWACTKLYTTTWHFVGMGLWISILSEINCMRNGYIT